MILDRGDKLVISQRRLYEAEQPRYFAGEVVGYGDGIATVSGYSWSRDPILGEITRKDQRARKLVPICSGLFIVHQLDDDFDLDHLAIVRDDEGRTWATDIRRFRLDLSERIRAQ